MRKGKLESEGVELGYKWWDHYHSWVFTPGQSVWLSSTWRMPNYFTSSCSLVCFHTLPLWEPTKLPGNITVTTDAGLGAVLLKINSKQPEKSTQKMTVLVLIWLQYIDEHIPSDHYNLCCLFSFLWIHSVTVRLQLHWLSFTSALLVWVSFYREQGFCF